MLSELERELYRVRAKQEGVIFKRLDDFFDDPTDENLALLQDARTDHRETCNAIDTEYKKRTDAEAAAKKMDAAMKAMASSYVATPPPFPAPVVPRSDYAKELRERIEKIQAQTDERMKQMAEEAKRIRTEDTDAAKKTWWERVLGV